MDSWAPSLKTHSLPESSTSHTSGYNCYNWWTYIDTSLSSKVHSVHYDSLLWNYGLDKCIIACIHYYSIIQNSSLARKVLCVLFTPSSLLSQLLSITEHFPGSMILSLLECHIDGITQYVVFSSWLLPLNNMHLSFLHVFSWFGNSFLFTVQ